MLSIRVGVRYTISMFDYFEYYAGPPTSHATMIKGGCRKNANVNNTWWWNPLSIHVHVHEYEEYYIHDVTLTCS